MPSPFPGMDPYIESSGHWPDFHSKFINVCQELILDTLPVTYDARVQEEVRLTDLAAATAGPPQKYVPDVLVSHDPKPAPSTARSGSQAMLEPLVLRTPAYQEVRDEWIEIVTQPDRELVTVIELLSPADKYNPGFAQHQAKRASLVHAGVHVVDIDLLTAGLRPSLMPPMPASDYAALVFRADGTHQCDAYVWGVRRPLPTIPVPLRDGDAPVMLALATAFGTTFDRGRYARAVRYDQPPKVRLSDADLRWAAEIGAGGASAVGQNGGGQSS